MFECKYAPKGMFTEKSSNQNLGCHMADNEINFDMNVFLSKIKASLLQSDKYFLAGRLFVNIISKQIFAICSDCNQVYTYYSIDQCCYHKDPTPHFQNGSFVGHYACCGK